MKKFTIKSLAITLALTLLTTIAQTIPAEAKASPKLSYKTAILCAPSWDLKGTSVQFKVKNAGGKKVTWKSSNKAVATVTSKGLVKPLKRGNTTITAKVGNKTLSKTVHVHKHTFDYYNPDKGCKYCKHKTPSYFYSVKTARRDMEQFVKDITTPGMTDAEKMRNFREWDSEAHCGPGLCYSDDFSTLILEQNPYLPKTAYKYIPDWYSADLSDPETFEDIEDKIMDEWCKPRYDKYGQQIPRVTMAEPSFAEGYDGLCGNNMDRTALFCQVAGIEYMCIEGTIEGTLHGACLYKIDGKWYTTDGWGYLDDVNGKGDHSLCKADFAKGGVYQHMKAYGLFTVSPLYELGLINNEERLALGEAAERNILPVELRP